MSERGCGWVRAGAGGRDSGWCRRERNHDGPHVIDAPETGLTGGRSWRFWCNGCDEVEFHTYSRVDGEEGAALDWFRAHHDHGLGGFVMPIVWDEEPCSGCGAEGFRLRDGLCDGCYSLKMDELNGTMDDGQGMP